MVDTYKGESPAKKIARAAFLSKAVLELDSRKLTGKIVVLASREMGDFAYLNAFGYGDRTICVERDREAFEIARKKFPQADVRFGDIADVVEAERDVSFTFLDFCAPICRETVLTTRRVIEASALGSLVGIGLLKGREQSSEKLLPPTIPKHRNRKERRVWAKLGRMQRMGELEMHTMDVADGSAPLSFRDLVRAYTKRYPPEIARNLAMMTSVMSFDRHIAPVMIVNYQSSGECGSRGVPMTLGLYGIETPMRSSTKFDDGYDIGTASLSDVREYALNLIDAGYPVEIAAGCYNLPKSTVAAWKAHATRGTYARSG